MRNGRTISRLTFLTKILFEMKYTMHCYHLQFFVNPSPNIVHPSFVTALVSPVKQVLSQLTFHCNQRIAKLCMKILINQKVQNLTWQ
jgi:hypothetical protein